MSEEQALYRLELGARIEAVVGKFATKAEAAAVAGVTTEQLNKWIKGTVKVPVEGLKALADATGGDFGFLVAGRSSAIQGQQQPSIDSTDIGAKVVDLTIEIYRRSSVRMSDANLAKETVARLLQLLRKAENGADYDELVSLLPWLRRQIEKDIEVAQSDPGTGKHSA